jgi:hypothetical protein
MKDTLKRLARISGWITAIALSLCLYQGVAHATTIDELIAKVNQEYSAGHMDAATKTDLNSTLNDAKGAPSAEAREAYIDTFKEIVAGSGGAITSQAASTLTSMANSL